MKVMGLRISDEKNEILDVMLSDFLEIIPDRSLHWAIVFSDVVFKGDGLEDCVVDLQNRIEKTKDGVQLTWEELARFASQIHQEIDLDLLGSRDPSKLHRYQVDEEMYQACEVVIQAIDTSYWEVHTHDKRLIDNIRKRFKEIEVID